MSTANLNTSIRIDASDHALGAASTAPTLIKEVSSIIPHTGPLASALGVTKELISIVNQMRENKDQCLFLVERILRILRDVAKESARLKDPIRYGSPAADRLNKLISAIKEIKKDAEAWKNISGLDRFWSRDKIKPLYLCKNSLSSLTPSTMKLGTAIQPGSAADNYMGERGSGVRPDRDLVAHIVPDAGVNRGGLKHQCFQGTREVVISEIMNWAGGDHSQRICWLSGPAGFGKSAIMQTVAERLDEKGNLAASFFFLRGAGARSEFTRVIATIAYHISHSIPDSQPLIQQALHADPTVVSQPIQHQLQKLVLDPLKQIPTQKRPMIIVVDALDECDDYKSITEFIQLLVEAYDHFPFRFLLASRIENHIAQAFTGDQAQSMTCFLKLETFDATYDITTFITSRFDEIRKHRPRLFQKTEQMWTASEELAALAEKSDGLFIFAAIVVAFIMDGKGLPQEKLKQILNSHVGLDPLYAQVLSEANHDDAFTKVLSAITYMQKELSITSLAKLLDLTSEVVVDRLMEIQSIIKIPADNPGSVQLNHASFRDFLLDNSRSKEYYQPLGEVRMAIWSLACMVKCLKQDQWPNDEAETYACLEWCFHLERAIRGRKSGELATEIVDNVSKFIRCEALEVWINTLLLGEVSKAIECLQETKTLLQVRITVIYHFI
ncbi:hypothetical protein H0H87_004721 [Tephrocybe sp. NHM501043]|nr:hypothetical protein H0H87_004721 [Tephrocybe sp. NHM501043]